MSRAYKNYSEGMAARARIAARKRGTVQESSPSVDAAQVEHRGEASAHAGSIGDDSASIGEMFAGLPYRHQPTTEPKRRDDDPPSNPYQTMHDITGGFGSYYT